MEICDCMYKQNESGDSVCNVCRGDIYACDCPLIHSSKCDEIMKKFLRRHPSG